MKLYEGRVPGAPDPLMDQINRSLPFDIRLLPHDLATNRAWALELERLGIYTPAEREQIHAGLEEIGAIHQAGAFATLPRDEDVHTLVERLLTEKLGPLGARIHTGRSRNDQVVCDLRLYTVEQLGVLTEALNSLIATIADRAEEHAETLFAGTTHLQPALPITLGQFLCSLAAGLVRDAERLRDACARTNRCPLGAGAMAGSGFPVDRQRLADLLGFEEVLPNSIDAVSDRDFCQETISACSLATNRLSRYAEQFIVWANPAFGYIRFADDWSTGSSMMPQKRNPDAMELIRGKAARVTGALTTLLTLTKGVPLTYAKDLQEDKEPLFDALDTTNLVITVFDRALASAQFFPRKMAAALGGDMLATDLADVLARAGVPFRKAHERVAAIVSKLEAGNKDLSAMPSAELIAAFPELAGNPPRLDFAGSVAARDVEGGTAPPRVHDQIKQLRALVASHRTAHPDT
jgi:argininosuccinate lyase